MHRATVMLHQHPTALAAGLCLGLVSWWVFFIVLSIQNFKWWRPFEKYLIFRLGQRFEL